ncbi:MAG: hypothetical protein QXU98_10430 [Candidatus Parvarchaeota archaeon]
MGDSEDIIEESVPKKIVLLPVIIASFIIFLILLHDGIFTSLNLSLISEFAIAFTVTISIFISILLSKHLGVAIMFFVYVILPTLVAWFFFGMPGTSVPYSDAINYAALLGFFNFIIGMFVLGVVLDKDGSSSDDSRSRDYRSMDDGLYPYSPMAKYARDTTFDHIKDMQNLYDRASEWQMQQQMYREREQQREWERNHE